MLPPFECCLDNSILHESFIMGYSFTLLGWRTSFYNPSLDKTKSTELTNGKGGQNAVFLPIGSVLDTKVSQKDEGVKGAEKKKRGHSDHDIHSSVGESFAQQIEDYKAGNLGKYDTLVVGGTPKVLQRIGFNALPMTIDKTHIDYALKGTKDDNHRFDEVELMSLPEKIRIPLR